MSVTQSKDKATECVLKAANSGVRHISAGRYYGFAVKSLRRLQACLSGRCAIVIKFSNYDRSGFAIILDQTIVIIVFVVFVIVDMEFDLVWSIAVRIAGGSKLSRFLPLTRTTNVVEVALLCFDRSLIKL